MNFSSKISPADSFPEDLRTLDDQSLHVLNSKVLRELDAEYSYGEPEAETEFRKEELDEELSRRETAPLSAPLTLNRAV